MSINILHLFPELLSLYGESGNVEILKKTLEDNGCSVNVTCSEEIPSFDGFDFIYIGSGTETALIEAGQRLSAFSKEISKALENSIFLVTGNSMSLFGKEISDGKTLSRRCHFVRKQHFFVVGRRLYKHFFGLYRHPFSRF